MTDAALRTSCLLWLCPTVIASSCVTRQTILLRSLSSSMKTSPCTLSYPALVRPRLSSWFPLRESKVLRERDLPWFSFSERRRSYNCSAIRTFISSVLVFSLLQQVSELPFFVAFLLLDLPKIDSRIEFKPVLARQDYTHLCMYVLGSTYMDVRTRTCLSIS